MKFLLFLIAVGLFIWYKPLDDCREYSDFNCEQIKKADYNVIFYFNNNSEDYNLGSVSGLENCSIKAKNYASSQSLYSKDWTYVCCMKAKGSECYEKHR